MRLQSLLKLSPNQIQNGTFPLKSLLKDSLYYPSCDIDGELIRYCNMHFNRLGISSYVYADYASGRDRLMANLDTFRGYHLIATRELSPDDVEANKVLRMPKGIDREDYHRYQGLWQPFGQWSVFERNKGFGEHHGPRRFSLLYLGAEGVAAYSGLYLNNNITPKAIAIIQPGHGFGGNWTDFTALDGSLSRTMLMGKSMPEFFFYGGLTVDGYNNLPWPGYELIDRVVPYYPSFSDSSMTVWQGNVIFLKVYNGRRESNYGISLQVMDNPRTRSHKYVNQVFVESLGHNYEAAIGTYRCGDTLRGAETIRDLIIRNNWRPGDTLLCSFISYGDIHIYRLFYE